jgi:rsbT antagonist protein RsbS
VSSGGAARIPLQISGGCVVASIQVDLTADVLRRFRVDLLGLIQRVGAQKVILDLSGLEIMDLRDFEEIRQTVAMARLMGAESVLSGLRAGVVSSLVDLGAETEGLSGALDLDDAFRLVAELKSASADPDSERDDE